MKTSKPLHRIIGAVASRIERGRRLSSRAIDRGPRIVAIATAVVAPVTLLLLGVDLGPAIIVGLPIGLLPMAAAAIEIRHRTRNLPRRQTKSAAETSADVDQHIPIIAGMASIPQRQAALAQAVESILWQVDRLYVYLNDYDDVPSFLHSNKVTVFRSQDHGNLQDTGKFFGLQYHSRGIYLTLDDDIVYPTNYAAQMAESLDCIGFEGAVGVHGVYYPVAPSSFMNRKVVRYRDANSWLRPVSLLGTGTVAFSIEHFGITLEAFPAPGMADVWFAVYAKLRRQPLFAVARSAGWLADASVPDDSPQLWLAATQDSSTQTKTINEQLPWGYNDLAERLNLAKSTRRLPQKWEHFSRFTHTLRAHGADEAVATLPSQATVADYVAFYLEPSEVLDVAEAALRVKGQKSGLFRIAVTGAGRHDPRRAATLLQQGAEEARGASGGPDVTWLATHASRYYRHVGDFARARHSVEDAIRADGQNSRRLRSELVSLALDLRRYEDVVTTLTAWPAPVARDTEYHDCLAHAIMQSDGPEAAAPWIAEIFLTRAARASQRRLISEMRKFNAGRHPLSALPPFRIIERACASGTLDPHLTACLYLAAGDRQGARNLIESASGSLTANASTRLMWLEAAAADTLDEALDHVNRALAADGFMPLALAPPSSHDTLPLRRFRAAPGSLEGDAPVSVIMTAFNCRDTIQYAIDSILSQTMKPLEVIVVDDASTDGTAEIAMDYASRDGRVVLLRSDQNSGAYVCRNLALDKARGEYIAIQDCDDYAHPERLAHQVAQIDDCQTVACYTSHVRLAEHGFVPENNGELIGEGPMTLMMQRSVFDELGYFLAVRSRGDVEHRDRMIAHYGAHRVRMDDAVLLFAHDAVETNSRMFDQEVSRVAEVRGLKAEARRWRETALARGESLYIGKDGELPR